MILSRRESPFHLDVYGATNIGGKHANEDHFRYDPDLGVFAVADGVTHLPAPNVAAEAAIEAFISYVTDPNVTPPIEPRERMERALGHVHRRVREQAAAEDHLRGMATTLACAMERGRLLLVGHVGDSRVIRIREGRLERLTTDHRRGTDPLVLSRAASLGADPKALTRAIGLADSLAPSVSVEALHADDGVLVATAGLTSVLDDQTILATVQRGRHPRSIVSALIQGALARVAPDNLTCVYAHWRSIST